MPPFLYQRLSAAHALAIACCERSLQPVRDFFFRCSVVMARELAPSSLGNNASQVRLLVVPVKR
jgi:sulfur relay (sulfurtransferase) complex TusBCD TusD component (DsrE family)